MEVVSLFEGKKVMLGLMEGEWSCYGGGQFKGGRMLCTEAACLMEGDWSC